MLALFFVIILSTAFSQYKAHIIREFIIRGYDSFETAWILKQVKK